MTLTIRGIPDTYVSQVKPSTNYASAPTLALRTGGPGNAYPLIRPAGIPVGPDVTIVSAVLKFFNTAAWAGAVTVTAKRVTKTYNAATVKYTTMPTVTATDAASQTRTGAAAGSEWDLDVTAIVQAWAAGASNYGLRLEATGTTALHIHAANASGKNSDMKPVLVITWSGSPETPTALNPDASTQVSIARPTLGWVYSDPAGGAMAAYQLQMNDADVWTAPDYDSGVIASAQPQHQLTVDVPLATPEFWRVRQQNAAGKWSAWSSTASFGRTPKSALTLLNPAVAPDNVVTELTPPTIWAFTGTQTRWQVLRPKVGNAAVILADSKEQSGPDLSYTSPVPLAFVGGAEQVTVRVWDDVDRASTPGDLPYVEVSRVFTYDPGSPAGGPVTGLLVTIDDTKPFAALTWSRATAPDFFNIVRDGVAIATDLPASDLLVTGTSYRFVDITASPRNEHTWRVDAVVNGVASATSPSRTDTIEPVFAWLLDPDDPDWWIAMADQDSGSWDMGEESAMQEVRGSDRLVLISEALRGYEGSFSGGLYSDLPGLDSLTAQQLRDRCWDLKRNPTHVWRLVMSDMNIPVVVRKVVVSPSAEDELDYALSFEFYQQGELPWVA